MDRIFRNKRGRENGRYKGKERKVRYFHGGGGIYERQGTSFHLPAKERYEKK